MTMVITNLIQTDFEKNESILFIYVMGQQERQLRQCLLPLRLRQGLLLHQRQPKPRQV